MLSEQRQRDLTEFCRRTGLTVVKLEVLDTALTHKSYVFEQKTPEQMEHNERLEFLGDAVVGLAVAEYLFKRLPDRPEGELASMRAGVVSAPSLARRARVLGLGRLLRLGKGEEKSGGRHRESLLANAFEAVTAAVYLSAGFAEAAAFVVGQLKDEMEAVISGNVLLDPKSALREMLQQHSPEVPRYDVLRETGPDHDKEFHVVVCWQGRTLGCGKGRSKKLAEQEAAKTALRKVEKLKLDLLR